MMKNWPLRFTIVLSVIFSLMSVVSAFGQNSLNGIWKAVYVTSYSSSDTGIQYTRIFLSIQDSIVTLKNFDGMLVEKTIFENTGTIDQEKGTLKFNDNEYIIRVNGNYMEFDLNNSPKEVLRLKKLELLNLGDKKEELYNFLTNNFITGTFDYYEEKLNLEFYKDSSMIVSNSIKTSLTLLNRWSLVHFGNELFLYLGEFGPMVHITKFQDEHFDFDDEFDAVFKGSFKSYEPEIITTKAKLIGIWEQEIPDTIGISRFPQTAQVKDFYPKEVLEIKSDEFIKYHFFTRESSWRLSKDGAIMTLKSFNDSYRIISIDADKLVIERRNRMGNPDKETFIKRKNVPKPTSIRKYLK